MEQAREALKKLNVFAEIPPEWACSARGGGFRRARIGCGRNVTKASLFVYIRRVVGYASCVATPLIRKWSRRAAVLD
jgi:hypothetical protein